MKQVPKFQFREILDLLIEFVYLATIFIIPLYFSFLFPTYNLFELSKQVIFQSLVWLLLFLTLTKLIYYWPSETNFLGEIKKVWIWFKKYGLIPTIFILGLGITLLFSTNILHSFYGSYDRRSGLLSYLFYFLWLVLLVFNIRTVDNRLFRKDLKGTIETKINRLIGVITLSGFLVALYGILQILGIDFLHWPEDPLITNRALSTFGQPNFLASWLVMVIPLCAYLIYRYKKIIWRFIYSLILLAQIICLYFTASRGGLVALGLTAILFIAYLMVFSNIKRVHKYLLSLGLVALVSVGFLGLNIFMPDRVGSLLDLQSGSTAARMNFYRAAGDAITKKPFFGYGMENGTNIFINYYQVDWGVYGNVASSTDKAHNLILDIILTTGFFGLIFYVIFYYYFFRLAHKNIIGRNLRMISLALSLGAASYLFSLLFSFTIVTGEIYFWTFLALLVTINMNFSSEDGLEAKSLTSEIKNVESKNSFISFKTLLLLGAFVITSSGIYYQFRVLTADYYFNRVYSVLETEQYFTTFLLAKYMDEEKTDPVAQENYHQVLADKLSDLYPRITELSSRKVSREKLQELDGELSANSFDNLFVKGKINSVLGNYAQAERYFNRVAAQTPFWPKTYIELGRLFVRSGNLDKARANYEIALTDLPNINNSYLNIYHLEVVNAYRKMIYRELGDTYFSEKNYREAEKYYQLSYVADVSDFTIYKKIADTYYFRGDLKTALDYNFRGLERSPRDYNWYLSVASIYKEEGDNKLALSYLNQAIKLAPDQAWLLKLRSEY